MSECPWNGCNRVRGINFPDLAYVKYGYLTGDGVYNRQILVGFEVRLMDIMRVESGSIYGFRKTTDMGEWKVYLMSNNSQYDNEMKFITNGFELRNSGGVNLNLDGYMYEWIAFG